jgi:hypothetical protein
MTQGEVSALPGSGRSMRLVRQRGQDEIAEFGEGVT